LAVALFFAFANQESGEPGPEPGNLSTKEVEPAYLDPNQPVEARVTDLISRMTLDEKIGQLVQISKDGIRPAEVEEYFIGSVLSAGGGFPDDNSPSGWLEMVNGFQTEALQTRLGIPLLYGVDAVHGHGNMVGATIFPHQIGLGATRNPNLVQQIGAATAKEILATGIPWNFAPVVVSAQDIRWGRTYETYSEDIGLASELAEAYLQGLHSFPEGYVPAAGQTIYALATPKHYLADGGTEWDSSQTDTYILDQGDRTIEETEVRRFFLPPYQRLISAGALSIMPSYSSLNGVKMHASSYWLTDVLKAELGFPGLVISDLNAVQQVSDDYYKAVVTAVKAGVDMIMISSGFKGLLTQLKRAVESGDVPLARVDDAVARILYVKFTLGLFEHPFGDPRLQDLIGSEEHRQIAREAVRQSLVLLRNVDEALPITRDIATLYVAGSKADSTGSQSGGWTVTWQGSNENLQPGTTILAGIRSLVGVETKVEYEASGEFKGVADIGVVVVGENPYAEGVGDKEDLVLSDADLKLIERVREHCQKLVVILLSGRPLIITDQFSLAEAWVVAWLPGTEGAGVAEVLFGDYSFSGKLPYTWPRSHDHIPSDRITSAEKQGCEAPLFPFGYGLGDAGSEPAEPMDCP
jgi:beta-glucosidase